MAQQKNQEQALLKTSFFGGFNKSEVLSYIDQLREQNRQMELELEGQLDGVTRARGELAEQVTGFEGKVTEMETRLDASAGRIRELTGMVEMLRGAVTEQKRREEEYTRRVEDYSRREEEHQRHAQEYVLREEEHQRQLEEQRRREEEQEQEIKVQKERSQQLAARAQTYEFKAKRYEEISSQAGDILLEAGQDAKRLLEQAEQEAQRVKTTAVAVSGRITAEMHSMRTDLSAVRAQITEALHSLNDRLDALDHMIEEATPDFDTDKAVELLSAKRHLEGQSASAVNSPASILNLWVEQDASNEEEAAVEIALVDQEMTFDEVEFFDETELLETLPSQEYLTQADEPQAVRPMKAGRHGLLSTPARNHPPKPSVSRVATEKKRSAVSEPRRHFFGGAAKG